LAVAYEAAGLHEFPRIIDGWQMPLGCEIHDSLPVLAREGVDERE
jgi:hypothetical protein